MNRLIILAITAIISLPAAAGNDKDSRQTYGIEDLWRAISSPARSAMPTRKLPIAKPCRKTP